MKQIDESAFAGDAIDGMAFHDLRMKYGTSPSKTKKLMNEALGIVTQPSTKPELVAAIDEEPEQAPDEEPEAFDITVTLPTSRLMDMLRGIELPELLRAVETMSADYRANLLQAVMQQKFDRLLEEQTVSIPELAIA